MERRNERLTTTHIQIRLMQDFQLNSVLFSVCFIIAEQASCGAHTVYNRVVYVCICKNTALEIGAEGMGYVSMRR